MGVCSRTFRRQICRYEERALEGLMLQIPPDQYRCHYVRARVNVHLDRDGSLAIFHGPRKLADYDEKGKLKKKDKAA